MRTVSVRSFVDAPEPWQVGHGVSTTRPEPRQARQGSANANPPWLRLLTPAPPQTEHVDGAVPGAAPEPPQVSQAPGAESRSGTVAPRTASANAMVTSASRS